MDNTRLRKYFFFNYGDHFRYMIEHSVIGLSKFEDQDLSLTYNAVEPQANLNTQLSKIKDITAADKLTFKTFMFDMDLDDIVCLVDSKSIRAIGVIESNYKYARGKELPHRRQVRWINKDKINVEDGNHRITIREVTKTSTYEIIESIINEALIEDDETLVNTLNSEITTEQYVSMFQEITLNPLEIELLSLIYFAKSQGLSIYDLQKHYVSIDVADEIEQLSKKICKFFNVKKVDGQYRPNLFTGIVKDGHICLIMKKELSLALLETNMIMKVESDDNQAYTLQVAQANSVYPTEMFEEAYSLLERKRAIFLIGDWSTGKSYFARKLAYLMIGEKKVQNILHIKLSHLLTYDLLMNEKNGILYNFIEKARRDPMDNYIVIFEDAHLIDLASITPEFSYLIEENNRGIDNALDVSFEKTKFYLPTNLYTIETYLDVANVFSLENIKNNVIFEMPAMYNDRFKKMFENQALGQFIIETYKNLNLMIKKYGITINHGLFLKRDRGITVTEYETLVKHKFEPILKRIIDKDEFEIARIRMNSFKK